MLRTSTLLVVCTALLVAAGCGGGGTTATVTGGPVIDTLEPASGGMYGGTPLVLRGTNLSNQSPGQYEVLIGGQPAVNVVVISDDRIECETPPGSAGTVPVTIIKEDGEGDAPDGFTYYPPPTLSAIDPVEGSKDGGIPVTVTGTGFSANEPGVTLCFIGGKLMENIEIVSDTTLTGLTPASWAEAPKDVLVRNRNGSATLASAYRYKGPLPVITSLDPAEGTWGGGTLVTCTGQDLTATGGDIWVQFGDLPPVLATRIDDDTDTKVTVLTPSTDAPGLVDLTVSNENGTSPPLMNAFTYVAFPVLDSLTESTGGLIGGETVKLYGRGFLAPGAGTTIITFGGVAVAPLSIDFKGDDEVWCTAPQAPGIGPVDVVLQNDIGSAMLAGGYTYVAPCWWESDYGTLQPVGDDSAFNTPFSSFSFPFYGSAYTDVWVSTNGSLSFGGGYSTYSSYSLATLPQIAVWQGDMNTNPAWGGGGSIYVRELGDRAIVTYENVLSYSSLATGSLTCQVHLVDTGEICILYNDNTMSAPSNDYYVAVNSGVGGTASALSQDVSAGGSTASSAAPIVEMFTAPQTGNFDMNGGFLWFVPNVPGGFDWAFLPIIP